MLRHYEQHEGGVKVYTQNLLDNLLSLSEQHQYVLMYQNPKLIGQYRAYPNVREVALPLPGKFFWDQVAVPWMAHRQKLDVVFNPKFTIPFLCRKLKRVFVLHGSEWFVIPETFQKCDQLYVKIFVPIYCRQSDKFISVSHTVKSDIVKFTGVSADKVVPIHNGFDAHHFRVIKDARRLNTIKENYQLPDKFLLWIGQIYPPKNFGRLLRAFAQVKDQMPHQLVIAGEERWRAKRDLDLVESLGLKDRIYFAGWVSHDDLPAFYNLADLFVFPSLYEGFGIPLLEAMACGCPILTANVGTPPEVVEEAACLVNPRDVADIARGMQTVLSNAALQETMIEKGLARVQFFSWKKCAAQTLAVLESLQDTGSKA